MQGNVINKSNGTVFKFSGVRIDEDFSNPQEDEEQNSNSPMQEENFAAASPARILELKNLELNRSSPSESSDGSSNSDTTEEGTVELNFDAEDEEIPFDNELGEKIISYFNVAVNDMDTGLKYEFPFVKSVQLRKNKVKKSREDVCKLTSLTDRFKFTSLKRIHGDKAELVLHKQFGSRHSGKNFLLFKGEMAFGYKYPVCYPQNDVHQTKWCL